MTPLAQQELDAETAKRQAWDIFVASLRDYAARYQWGEILTRAHWSYDGMQVHMRSADPMSREIESFAEGYGWPDTLRAIAQAMQADEQAKQEAMDRR